MSVFKSWGSPHNQTSPGWLRGAEAAAGCDSELRVSVWYWLNKPRAAWANCPSQIQAPLSPGSAVPPHLKQNYALESGMETKPTRQRTTAPHFLLLSVEFPKLTMPSTNPSEPVLANSCSKQPALTWIWSEFPPKPPGMMQMLCLGINPWETVRSQHCAVDTAVSGAFQGGFLRQRHCCGT